MSIILRPDFPKPPMSEGGASPVSSHLLPRAGEATLSQQWADAVRWGRYQEADVLLKQLFASVFTPVNPENAEHWEKMIRSRPPRLPEHEQDTWDYQEEREGDFYR